MTPPSDEPIVEARNLIKHYGTFEAVRGISFTVRRGECFGFLGPNGAGKTTTIRMINCTADVTYGHLKVLGLDVRTEGRTIKGRMGLVPQENNLDPDFSVQKNLTVYARYFDITGEPARQKAAELLEFVAMTDRAGAHVEHLSGGLKRRLIIARGLVNEPQILVLDEPTTGLDPQARHVIWDKVRALRRRGVTILLTTHYMDEAEALCDRLIIIDQGKILVEGAPRDLIREHAGQEVLEVLPRNETDMPALDQQMQQADLKVERAGDFLVGYGQRLEPIAEQIAAGPHAAATTVRRATLEDVFLRLTGRGLRD